MKKIVLLCMAMSFMSATHAQLAVWTFEGTTAPSSVDMNITASNTLAVGVSNIVFSSGCTSTAYNADGWPATYTGGSYYQFSVTPVLGGTMTITTFSISTRRVGNGPASFVIRSSLDGYTTNIASGTNSNSSCVGSGFTLSNVFQNLSSSVTFRVYGINGAGTFRIDNVIISGDVALPVTLTSFNVKAMSPTMVELVWVTESEENNNYFELQHSTSGQNFESFAKMGGAGTSTLTHQYQLIHEQAVKGTNYYRIKQVDYDGTYTFSPIKAVELKGVNNFSLFPNFTAGDLHLVSPDFTRRRGTIEVFDINGNRHHVEPLSEGANHTLVDVSSLDKGFYFVRVISDGEEAVLKFIKQ